MTSVLNLSTKKLMMLLAVGVLLWLGGYWMIGGLEIERRFFYQLWLSRGAIMLGVFLIVIWVVKRLPYYFKEEGSAYNLAVFRILFFGFFAVGSIVSYSSLLNPALHFAEMSTSTRVQLPYFQWLVNIIPVNAWLIKSAMVMFGAGAFGALLGFKTRWSILLFTIAAIYLMGIPNLYGKINHNHHIIWFASILAFSPCGDVLSIDARFRGTPVSSYGNRYKLPFLFMWLLMAWIYFFPGFWKVWSCGLDWALTENVRNHMYWKWHEIGDFLPFLRLDLVPTLYKFTGLFTVFFELLFIVLIINRKTRWVGAVAGILFHLGTLVFMNIFFVVLVLSYASFVNWERLFSKYPQRSDLQKERSNKWVWRIGVTLLVVNLLFGIGRVSSFPFSVYPTFDYLIEPTTQTINFYAEGSQLDKSILRTHYTAERYRNFEHQLIQAHKNGELNEKSALLKEITEKFEAQEIEVYISSVSVIPETMHKTIDSLLVFSSKGSIK